MKSKLIKHELGFWTVSNKPLSDDLQKYYSEKYYQQGLGSYDLTYSEEEIVYFKAKIAQRHQVIQRYFKGSGNFLDVGCGEGFALNFFYDSGWNCKGLDFSSMGVASQNPHVINLLQTGNIFDLLSDEINSGRLYDVVWLQNVLEHVIDPLALMESLKKLISFDGIVVITVPNDFSLSQKVAIEKGHVFDHYWVVLPDHLNYFDHHSLTIMAEALGWDCLELLGDFPVDWFLFNSASNYIQNRSLGKSAHIARVQIENMLNSQPSDQLLQFWASAGRLGIGRDLTVFLRLKC